MIFDETVYRNFQAVPCSQIDWAGVSAEEATQLAQFGCYPPFIQKDVYYTAPETFEGGGGGAYSPTAGEQPPGAVPLDQPLYTAPTIVEQERPVIDYNGINGGSVDNFGAYFSLPNILMGAIGGAASAFQDSTDMSIPTLPQVLEQIGTPQYRVQVTPGASCWDRPMRNGRINRRARVKLQRMPDGSTVVVRYCAPKRMNFCNPRALGRAARRLGGFQRMASGIEKLIQRSLKKSGARRPRMSYGCAPKKRCR